MSFRVGCRCRGDLVLLWQWCRPAARAPILTLAWELPYAKGVALKKTKQKERLDSDWGALWPMLQLVGIPDP